MGCPGGKIEIAAVSVERFIISGVTTNCIHDKDLRSLKIQLE